MATELRDAKQANEKQQELLANLWGLCLGEVFVFSLKEDATYETSRAYERTVGGWLYHFRESFFREDRNEWETSMNTTFIPFVEKERWDA